MVGIKMYSFIQQIFIEKLSCALLSYDHKPRKQKSCPAEHCHWRGRKCNRIGKQIQNNYKIKTRSFANMQENILFYNSYFDISVGRDFTRTLS